MAKLSVLGKLKFNETFFFPLKKEWIYYIQDNEALLEKIDAIATEENGEIGIKFLKRYGISPKENETVKEYLDSREKADKAYLEKIKAIGQKTGLSTAEIEGVVVNDGSIRERIEQVMVDALDGVVSIHTLHELEARIVDQMLSMFRMDRGFHSYASRIGSKMPVFSFGFCFGCVSIHTLHELEASNSRRLYKPRSFNSFHSYASRIGSKSGEIHSLKTVPCITVSIHTLHELEARPLTDLLVSPPKRFHSYASRIGSKSAPHGRLFPFCIFSFHSYASRIGSKSHTDA